VSGELLAKMKTCDETWWNPQLAIQTHFPKL
jgi:hypothetical protein